ncbi:MAG: phenylalanine--tRNA ligase subunit beta, partial [Eubacteriaceae bacterium]|nr:phenylalanine--tRNA ligase subunit beta [Eubacteriaceae bacterium]
MFVPQIWLRDFVDIPEDIKVFDKIMTRSGTMVEGYEYRGEGLENIVSARVETIERHPDSDHMWVCSLTDGKNTYQVVTGAQNVKAGDIVPLAKDGATVSGGKKIVTSELRGVRSEGMLCSGEELG